MNDAMKILKVNLLLDGKLVLDCKDLETAFGWSHSCREPVQCYQTEHGFYFLCHTHASLQKREFRLIQCYEDIL